MLDRRVRALTNVTSTTVTETTPTAWITPSMRLVVYLCSFGSVLFVTEAMVGRVGEAASS